MAPEIRTEPKEEDGAWLMVIGAIVAVIVIGLMVWFAFDDDHGRSNSNSNYEDQLEKIIHEQNLELVKLCIKLDATPNFDYARVCIRDGEVVFP